VSRDLDLWAYQRGVSRPTMRSSKLNSRFRVECLNVHWFLTCRRPRKNGALAQVLQGRTPHGAIGRLGSTHRWMKVGVQVNPGDLGIH
jgi:putative transposase